MKVIVNSIFMSFGAIINVSLVLILIWLIFAILGNSLLKNRMGHCAISNYYNVNKALCLEQKNEWKIYDTNFDNVLSSIFTLFIVGNLEGWVKVLNNSIDSNYEDIVITF